MSGVGVPNRREPPSTSLGLMYDKAVKFLPARLVATLRALTTAVTQFSKGYAQGPPGC
jgi:hypothetical protein